MSPADQSRSHQVSRLRPTPRLGPLNSHLRRGALPALLAVVIAPAFLFAAPVIPAYQRLRRVMAEQQTRATDDDGAWKLPDGEAFYNQRLRSHTTTDLTANEIHALGLEQVARNQAEMRAIFESQGYDVDALGGIGAAMQALAQEERFRYPDTDEGRQPGEGRLQKVEDRAQDIVDELHAFAGLRYDM